MLLSGDEQHAAKKERAPVSKKSPMCWKVAGRVLCPFITFFFFFWCCVAAGNAILMGTVCVIHDIFSAANLFVTE